MKYRDVIDKLPDYSLKSLARLSDEELAKFCSGFNPGTEVRILAEFEIHRRLNQNADRKASAALILAVLALGMCLSVHL